MDNEPNNLFNNSINLIIKMGIKYNDKSISNVNVYEKDRNKIYDNNNN